VQIGGFPELEISIEITEENLLRYGLTLDDIARQITLNNRDISAGMIRSKTEEILIRSRHRSTDPSLIGEIVIRANKDGSKILLRDVATIKQQFSETPSDHQMNGQQSVSVNVMKLPEEDLASISNYLKDYVETFNARHDNVTLVITYDFLELLNSRLVLLYKNGGLGLLLVLIALGLFLSLRLSFWVAFGIPASFFGMFLLGYLSGLTINMISLFGLIMVIGIVVDDAIVVGEAIFYHRRKGASRIQAVVEGVYEVGLPVMAAVVTSIVAFLPLAYVGGVMGKFIKILPVVVITCLAVSLLECLFVLPVHLNHLPESNREGESRNPFRRRINALHGATSRGLEWFVEHAYAPFLKKALSWRYVSFCVAVSLLLWTVGIMRGGFLSSRFFLPSTALS